MAHPWTLNSQPRLDPGSVEPDVVIPTSCRDDMGRLRGGAPGDASSATLIRPPPEFGPDPWPVIECGGTYSLCAALSASYSFFGTTQFEHFLRRLAGAWALRMRIAIGSDAYGPSGYTSQNFEAVARDCSNPIGLGLSDCFWYCLSRATGTPIVLCTPSGPRDPVQPADARAASDTHTWRLELSFGPHGSSLPAIMGSITPIFALHNGHNHWQYHCHDGGDSCRFGVVFLHLVSRACDGNTGSGLPRRQ